jgi:hypothetical protein
MMRSNITQLSYRRPKFGLPTIITTMFVLGFALMTGAQTKASEPVVETNFSCREPAILANFLAAEFPRSALLLKHALRSEGCWYTDKPIPVVPAYFVRKVRTNPEDAYPYGYIWAIRLAEQKTVYWYFWKNEHEALLKGTPGI